MWSPIHEDERNALMYSQIQEDLIGCQTFDICIYASRGMLSSSDNILTELCQSCSSTLSYQRWREIDLARPRELASVPLDTWSKLATRIKAHRKCKFLGQLWIKIMWFIIFIGFIPFTVESVMFGFVTHRVQFIITCIGDSILLVTVLVVHYHLKQKHLDEIFLPSVRGVLSEVKTPLAALGYEAELFRAAASSQQLSCFFQQEIWLLRFTVLPNLEERRVAKTLNTTTTTLPFVVPLATANPALLDVERVGV